MTVTSAGPLAELLSNFVCEQLTRTLAHLCPDGTLPERFLGFPLGADVLPDLLQVLSMLPELGVYELGGVDVEDRITALLPSIRGEEVVNFGSFRVAEALGRFGSWDDNSVLDECDEATRAALLQAMDSTHLIDADGNLTPGWPRNYWAVLARCEHGRDALGVLEDRSILDQAVASCSQMLAENPVGFIDDSPTAVGRYDIYSADICCFLEPLFDRLDREAVERALDAHGEYLLSAYMPNGASHVWGRSTGMLSLLMSLELPALLLHEERAPQPDRLLGIIHDAFVKQQAWWDDGLMTAHRDRAPYGYRGAHRLVQMSVDILGKIAQVALHLRHLDDDYDDIEPVAPDWSVDVDRFIPFNESNAGVWVYRHQHLQFQLPVVSGFRGDYVPWPASPGLFETPSDSNIICGLPIVRANGRWWTVIGLPVDVSKTPGVLSVRYDRLKPLDALEGDEHLAGQVCVVFRANGAVFTAQHEWQVPGMEAASVCIPEAGQALDVCVDGETIAKRSTAGLQDWRSFWSSIASIHETDITLTKPGHLQTNVTVRIKE